MKRTIPYVAMIAGLLLSSCDRTGDSREEKLFAQKYGVLPKSESGVLTGPYRVDSVLSLTDIQVDLTTTRKQHIHLRGIKPFPAPSEAGIERRGLQALFRTSPVYVHTNSVLPCTDDKISAVISYPTTQVCTGMVAHSSEFLYDTLNWFIVQVDLLLTGDVMLDTNDTAHVYYETFQKAESLAKKYRRGRWGSQ